MALPRLRQAVVAATDLAATCAALEAVLGVRDPFHDEGVGHFGLRNAVYAVGDTFVEVVSPVREGTAAGRQIERAGGDCGYMCMVEVADEGQARERLSHLGIRVVHDTSRDDIVDLHLHPRDVPGAIVALDIARPAGSWRWGGPAWTAAVPAHPPGGLLGLTVAVHDPATVARRWAEVLGVAADADGVPLAGGAQRLRFVPADAGEAERIVEVRVAMAAPGTAAIVAGVRFVTGAVESKEHT